MKWIRVSEGYPENTDTVLIFVPDSDWPVQAAWWGESSYSWCSFGFGSLSRSQVTHWTPLPDPPAGAAEDEGKE